MKRIIFSIFTDNVDEHTSATNIKREQFAKYKDQIRSKHESYAKTVGADYKLFEPNSTDYNEIQFEKLLKFEELAKDYDEILYLDYDVVPIRKKNFFKTFDLNTICAFNLKCDMDMKLFKWNTDKGLWHSMDMHSKACQKRALHMLDNGFGALTCLNTGVVGMNKEVVAKLNLSAQIEELKALSEEAKEDSLYPDSMTQTWIFNNEVILSYLIEKNNLPYTDIGIPWNFIVDDNIPTISGAAYFLHFVHKRFEMYFK